MGLSEGSQAPDSSVGAFLRRKFDEVDCVNVTSGFDMTCVYPFSFQSALSHNAGHQHPWIHRRGACGIRSELAIPREAATDL